MSGVAGVPEGAFRLSRIVAVAAAAVFGLTYSLAAPLIALDLSERGFSETSIGANAAMHAAGVLATAPLLPSLTARFGTKAMVRGALLLAAIALALFPVMPSVWLWFPLRFALGCASETLFVLSETWTSSLSDDRSRARAMAVYTATLSLGFAAGPLILSVVGTDGGAPYYIGAALAIFALALTMSPHLVAPQFDAAEPGGFLRVAQAAPVALATTLLNASVETAGLSFLALYAMDTGWDEGEATRLISALMIGAILLALPVGWLGDRMDRRQLMIALAVAAALGALVWPFALGDPWLAYPIVFLWGGVFVGVYTIMLAAVGSRFQGADLVAIYCRDGTGVGRRRTARPGAGRAGHGAPAAWPTSLRRPSLRIFRGLRTMARRGAAHGSVGRVLA